MAIETFPFETAEFLPDPEDIFHFLEAELEQNEPSYWPGAIAIVAKARGGFDTLSLETGIPAGDLRVASTDLNQVERTMIVRVMEAYRPSGSSSVKVA